MIKKTVVFAIAVGISLLAAAHRWNDSAHAIGVIKKEGGSARHPVVLESGEESYMLIVTATVLPPYQGDVRVTLEGSPSVPCEIHASNPVLDLGLHSWPKFKDNTFFGLKPGDRPALWVKMKPPVVDPVCGMAAEERFSRHRENGKEYRFCSAACLKTFLRDPEKYRDGDRARGKYTLAFTDTGTGASVLNVPVIFTGRGEARNAGEHHH